MVFTQFHITIGFQKPATCRSVPLHPLEGPCCFWEMTHIRCTPSTLHSSPSTGDSNDVSDLLQNSIASKDPEKSLLLWSVPEVPPKQNVFGNLGKFHKCHPKITSSERHFNQFQPCHGRSLRWWPQHCKPCCWSPGAVSWSSYSFLGWATGELYDDDMVFVRGLGFGRDVYSLWQVTNIHLDLGLT